MSRTFPSRRGVVLIVEDDANATGVMRDYLARAGFDVRVANNGWEALKQLRDGDIDVVVSETRVSDMDGASLREKCILSPESRDLPFLFLVSPKDTDGQVRALRSGVDDCVQKPVDPVVLVARVQAVLERRRAYAEMVRVDPLTRMLNRPTLLREIDLELQRAARYGRHATLALLDVDQFGTVNEEAGVAMGDLMLACLSGLILTNVRNVDLAGRYRGEAFLLYLPETRPDGARVLANRVQERLRHISDGVAAIPLSSSCALASIPEHGHDLESLLAALEAALAAAKLNGPGGCCLVAAPENATA